MKMLLRASHLNVIVFVLFGLARGAYLIDFSHVLHRNLANVKREDNTIRDSRFEDDTQEALEEMNKLFRHLFPLFPETKHRFILKHILDKSPTPGRDEITTAYISKPKSSHTGSGITAEITSIMDGGLSDTSSKEFSNVEEVASKGYNPSRPHNTRPHSTHRYSSKATGSRQWPSSPPPGKRGPECMRKCIAQGVLHPVQCHSLC